MKSMEEGEMPLEPQQEELEEFAGEEVEARRVPAPHGLGVDVVELLQPDAVGLSTTTSPSNGKSWSGKTESRAKDVTTSRARAQASNCAQNSAASAAVTFQAKGPP